MPTVGSANVALIPTMAKGALTAALGVGAFAAAAVGLEARFSKTMNVIQATSGASGEQMKSLGDLAMKMGKDTVFSAQDASNAMLELARGGIKPAQIEAGALAGTMTLAAAGNLEMGDAANIAVQSMGQFNLAGKDMAGIAAALAGAANASSASVSDMAQALSQAGLSANAVGFSIQETTAILAGFSNAGLKGSDAGTSLKTMLDRLQPSTASATSAFKQLGIITASGSNQFIKANGQYKSASQIAEVLKTSTEHLTDAEKKRLINQAFGSDSQRAATVLAKLGAKGLQPLIKATSDTGAAQKLAAANMKGTAGALESLKGSVETAVLKFGLLIAPAVQAGLLKLTAIVNGIGPAMARMVAEFKGNDFAMGALKVAGVALKAFGVALLAIGGFLLRNKAAVAAFAAVIAVAGIALAVLTAATWALNAALAVNPVVWVVIAIAALVAALVLAYKHVKVFHDAVNAVGALIKATVMPVVDALAQVFRDQIAPALAVVVAKFKEWMPTILQVGGFILGLYVKVYSFYFLILSKVLPVVAKFAAFLIVNLAKGIAVAVQWLVKIIGFVIRVGVAFVKAVIMVAKFYIGVVKMVGQVVKFIATLPGKAVSALASLASKLVSVAVKAFTSMGRSVISGIGKVIGFIKGLPGKAVTALSTLGSKLGTTATTALTKMKEKVVDGIGKVVDKLKEIPQKAKDAVGDLASTLYSKGVDLVQGFINGILSKIQDLVNQIKKLKDLLPGSPVKSGPLRVLNGRSQAGMRRMGASLVSEFAGGLATTSTLDASLANLTRRINVPRVRLGELSGSSAAAGGTHGALVNVEHMHVRDEKAAARELDRKFSMATAIAGWA